MSMYKPIVDAIKALTAAIQNQALVAARIITGPGSAPTPAAAAGAGTSPPTPTIAGSDARGVIRWGTGGTPAAGTQINVTFAQAYPAAPIVVISPVNAATAALEPFAAVATTTGFAIGTQGAPTADQGATVYQVAYHVIG